MRQYIEKKHLNDALLPDLRIFCTSLCDLHEEISLHLNFFFFFLLLAALENF